ncbi:MAG: hypothetical protein UH851_05475, partial [Clostridia bacterium]|nr:hypothetical protein [Clostridia bacterium]
GVVYLASEKRVSAKNIKVFSEITEKLKEIYPMPYVRWNGTASRGVCWSWGVCRHNAPMQE